MPDPQFVPAPSLKDHYPTRAMENEDGYLGLLRWVLAYGSQQMDRTGIGTTSIFGAQMRFDLRRGFPLLTTKRLPFRHIAEELFWFLRGETNVKSLQAKGVSIWDEWSSETGDLGPIYGKQWRDFGGVDQIKWAMDELRNNPASRRVIVSAWNPAEIPDMALPPCHTLFQFHVDRTFLDLQLYQRSGDMFLGVPFNIASYSLLLSLAAKTLGKIPRYFTHTLGDAHIYDNHKDAVREQMNRTARNEPILQIKTWRENLWDYTFEDLELSGYDPMPKISAPVAV
jgi:thymidylate synthase